MEHMKVPKYWKKEKREIAHTSKAIIKMRESHDQRSTKNIRIRKYFTHLHILIKVIKREINNLKHICIYY